MQKQEPGCHDLSGSIPSSTSWLRQWRGVFLMFFLLLNWLSGFLILLEIESLLINPEVTVAKWRFIRILSKRMWSFWVVTLTMRQKASRGCMICMGNVWLAARAALTIPIPGQPDGWLSHGENLHEFSGFETESPSRNIKKIRKSLGEIWWRAIHLDPNGLKCHLTVDGPLSRKPTRFEGALRPWRHLQTHDLKTMWQTMKTRQNHRELVHMRYYFDRGACWCQSCQETKRIWK